MKDKYLCLKSLGTYENPNGKLIFTKNKIYDPSLSKYGIKLDSSLDENIGLHILSDYGEELHITKRSIFFRRVNFFELHMYCKLRLIFLK